MQIPQPAQPTEKLRLAIQLDPRNPALYYDLGGLLLDQGLTEDAIDSYRTALKLAPGHPQILLQLGNAYSAQGRFDQAASCFQQAAHADPASIAAHYNLGNALRELGRPEQAAASYRTVLKLDARDADTHNNLGNVLREMGQLDQAIACHRDALRLNPKLHHARLHLLHQRQHICDWQEMDARVEEIRRLVRDEPSAQIPPFAFLALPGTTPAEQRRCAGQWIRNRLAGLIETGKRLNFSFSRSDKPKLRIGYLSGDFRQHPLAYLAAELFELHDRQHFEIYAYSYGAVDDTPIRRRVVAAFDHFIDIRPMSYEEAARRIYADNIDILVDLTGFTQNSRTGILALRPAPIQVNYLGFPGTFGDAVGDTPLADYLISDAFITPLGQAVNYSEKLALLPDSYQPNDRRRAIGKTPSRADCGLPEQAFVFCCFNQTFKITPQLFDIWTKLLKDIPGSVLWLLECNTWAKENLRREAQARGIAAERIIFAPRMPVEQHLARQRCADLFLDTLPYNAHTTASDALWAGLPLLTCVGDTFASRVAGSLLHAAGMPELVTSSLADYEALARQLATHPDQLAALRDKLAGNRLRTPLFDSTRFTRHLERAYRTMWQHYLDGKPQAFAVAALD